MVDFDIQCIYFYCINNAFHSPDLLIHEECGQEVHPTQYIYPQTPNMLFMDVGLTAGSIQGVT